jgi:hypothetical protein
MSIVRRSVTYKGRIKVSPGDLSLAERGTKTCTIRLGVAQVDGDMLNLTDGRRTIPVRIVAVQADRTYGQLTDSDADAEGMSSLEELREDLARYYGQLDPAQPVTVIHFSLLERPSTVDPEQAKLWG